MERTLPWIDDVNWAFAVSVNGGPFVDCGVALPPAVFPWVMLTWEGDTVTLLNVEKWTPKDDSPKR